LNPLILTSDSQKHYSVCNREFSSPDGDARGARDGAKSGGAGRITKPLIGDEPVFLDSKEVLTLQLADLHAWHARKYAEMRSHGREYDHPIWSSLCS
jgi:hypothetical protein